MLAIAPLAFDSIFLVSFCFAMLGLGILLLLVNGRDRAPGAVAPERPPSLRGAFALTRVPRYRALLIAGGALSLATASDAFVFLALQEKLDLGTSLFPLLFVGSAGTYMALAVPMGRLADRIGRGRVFLAGYGLLLAVYLLLLAPMAGWLTLALVLGLLGELLRRHRRRADGARKRRRAGRGPRQRPRAPRHDDEHRPADRIRRVRRRCGWSGGSTSRSPCSASRWSPPPSSPPSRSCDRRSPREQPPAPHRVHRPRRRSASRGRRRRRRRDGQERRDRGGERGGAPGASDAAARGESVVVFRSLKAGRPEGDGQMAVSSAAQPAPRTLEALRCDRSYFAAGHGICLARGSGFAQGYQVRLFDREFQPGARIDVDGVPSRARVSSDGRYGAVTMFVTGHSYAAAGTFSTQTTLIDVRRGAKLADLEDFKVMRGQRLVTAVDVNFWGVTFAPGDSDTFYATLATGGKTYLIKGSVQRAHRAGPARERRVPVALARRHPDRLQEPHGLGRDPWRLTVLDLATMRETPLAETRRSTTRPSGSTTTRALRRRRRGVGRERRRDGEAGPVPHRGRLPRRRAPVGAGPQPRRLLAGARSEARARPARRGSPRRPRRLRILSAGDSHRSPTPAAYDTPRIATREPRPRSGWRLRAGVA